MTEVLWGAGMGILVLFGMCALLLLAFYAGYGWEARKAHKERMRRP